jgi:alanyl-tRNA synthetase
VLEDFVSNITSGGILKGELAFNLYDTYGFPLDLTKDILRVRNIDVDEEGFDIAMHAQKQRARAAWTGSGEQSENRIWYDIYEKYGSTEFVGYEKEQVTAKVIAIVVGGVLLDSVNDGNAIVIFDKTPFYAESGGQVGDIGVIEFEGSTIDVIDTKKENNLIIHFTTEIPASLEGSVVAKVNTAIRKSICAHHSATHLLHAALRQVLGTHVAQKGSLVNAAQLRFDFSHFAKVSEDEMKQIENNIKELENNLSTYFNQS